MKIFLTKKEEQLLSKMAETFSAYLEKGKYRDIKICDVSSSDGKCSSNCSLYGTDLCHLLKGIENQYTVSERLLDLADEVN